MIHQKMGEGSKLGNHFPKESNKSCLVHVADVNKEAGADLSLVIIPSPTRSVAIIHLCTCTLRDEPPEDINISFNKQSS